MPYICSVPVTNVYWPSLSALVYLQNEVQELKELLVREGERKACSLQK